MKHEATVTIVVDSEDTSECDITVKMDPAVSNTQENVAAVVAMRMIKAFQEEMQ